MPGSVKTTWDQRVSFTKQLTETTNRSVRKLILLRQKKKRKEKKRKEKKEERKQTEADSIVN